MTTKSSMRWESVLMGSSNKQCTSRICNWTYIVYINDLPAKLQSKVQLFADDTIVYMAVANETDAAIVQKDLKLLEEWENNHRCLSTWTSVMCYELHGAGTPMITSCTTRSLSVICIMYNLHSSGISRKRKSRVCYFTD